jgi:two-component system sensor histidine kinase/response regulator
VRLLPAAVANALLDAVADATTDAIAFKDLDGRYRMINASGARMLGRTVDEVVGRSDADVLGAETAGAIRAADRAVLETGETVTCEIPLEIDGQRRILLSTRSPAHDEHGNVLGLVAVSTDITERKQIEDQLAIVREQEIEASRLKSEFLAHMSHEIRTPMSGVIGMTELLLDTKLTTEQREYTEMLRDSGEALLDVVNDILDLSKIEAGKLELESAFFDLRETVEDIGELLAKRAYDKGLELTVAIDHDVPFAVRGDRARVRQVLVNLISNAVKFTANGEVVVHVSVTKATDDGAVVKFEVTDTGIGIDETKLIELFEPFSQADRSTTRRYGGTGLGLTISRQLVEMMDGEIAARGELGQGSTFWFALPLERRPGPMRESDDVGSTIELEGRRVLVVDDNATNRRVVTGHAKAWGMHVEDAEDGDRALAMIKGAADAREPYTFVILDMWMPGMDGIELARVIADNPDFGSPALIMLSIERVTESEVAVPAAHIRKPVRQAKLRSALVAAAGKLGDRPSLPPAAADHTEPGPAAPVAGTVLVAEDNVVNQRIVARLLEKRGYDVVLVPDGRQAVEAVTKRQYAAVLMDCHMPQMDGYEATRQIRRHEGSTRHTPVIAMTASAMEGDRDRCLAAGMDDYLSKPLEPVHVNAVLEYWIGGPDGETAPEPAKARMAAPNGSSSVLDPGGLDDLRRRTATAQGSALIVDLVGLFLRDAPGRVEAIERALATPDAEALRQAAHALRGSSRTLGAVRMAGLCRELEEIGASGSVTGAAPLVAQLKEGLALTRRALERSCPEAARPAASGREAWSEPPNL